MHQARLVDAVRGRRLIIADGPGLARGARGRLWVEGLDPPLPFVVRHVTDDALHVAFELAAGQAERLRAVLDRAGLPAAA